MQLQVIQCPEDIEAATRLLQEGLTQVTLKWFEEFCNCSFDCSAVGPLEDRWFDYLITWPDEYDDWYGDGLLIWGRDVLPDVTATFMDGEAEQFADEAFYTVTSDMPRAQMRDRLAFLQQCIDRGNDELTQDVPHRSRCVERQSTQTRKPADSGDQIITLFQQQTAWHDEVRAIKWEFMPPDVKVPLIDGILQRPTFLIVHLSSGRRREQDVHWHLAQMAAARGIDIAVISMDTAVSAHFGNLESHSDSWCRLVQLYEKGYVAATIRGAPWETFLAARHVAPPADLPEAEKHRWPRPLRSFAQLFGLSDLRPKELRQCKQGSAFMLQATMVCIWHVVFGGLFLSEHPAPPADDSKASIWTSAIICLLRDHPDIQLQLFDQWRWGAVVRKPTGLLGLRLPKLHRSMYACIDPLAKYPQQTAIGKDEFGKFRTAVCKEYPPHFSAGMARAIIDQLRTEVRNGSRRSCEFDFEEGPVRNWLCEALRESSMIWANSSFMPDYQGH